MSATPSTLVLVPLFLALIIVFRRDLLALAIASSVVQAASVLDVTVSGVAIGLPVWIPLLGLSCIAAVAYNYRANRKPTAQRQSTTNGRAIASMTLFFLYATMSAFVMPFIFRGIPFVAGLSTRHDGDSTLRLSSTNLTQCAYLLLGAIVFYRCVFELKAEAKAKVVQFYLVACTISGIVGFYQVTSAYFGWYFPREILYSNAAYIQLYGTQTADFYRLNSTFTEASIAALFFAGAFGIAIMRCAAPHPKWRDVIQCLILAVALILTLSTTAYLALAIGLGFFGIEVARRSLRSTKAAARCVACLVALVLTFYLVGRNPQLQERVGRVTESVVSRKDHSDSYNQRHAADLAALDLLGDTSFLGGGLGSCRASSAFAELLGNTGLPGTAAFCLCIVFLVVRKRQASRRTLVQTGALAGLVLILIAHAVAVPDLVFPALWGLLGILAGPSEPKPKPGQFASHEYRMSGSAWPLGLRPASNVNLTHSSSTRPNVVQSQYPAF